MTDSALPGAMVIAALALALGFEPRRVAMMAMALALVFVIASRTLALPFAPETRVLACWIAVALLAIVTWLPTRQSTASALAAATVAGIIAGAALAPINTDAALVYPALAALLIIPTLLAVERGYGVAPRVVASWLFAVAALAAFLPFIVPHPGYVPDHRG